MNESTLAPIDRDRLEVELSAAHQVIEQLRKDLWAVRVLLQQALDIHSRDVMTLGWAERARNALSGTDP